VLIWLVALNAATAQAAAAKEVGKDQKQPATAAPGKDKQPSAAEEAAKLSYVRADNAYRKLAADEQRRKYRDRWLPLIERFQEAQRLDPQGPWAAAGLFRAAELCIEMHVISRRPADLQLASELLRRVITDYPKSRYVAPATTALAKLEKGAGPPPAQIASGTGDAKSPAAKTAAAEAPAPAAGEGPDPCYGALMAGGGQPPQRQEWLRCIGRLQDRQQQEADRVKAAGYLLAAGELYAELTKRSGSQTDRQRTVELLQELATRYADSPQRERAAAMLAQLQPPPPVSPTATRGSSAAVESGAPPSPAPGLTAAEAPAVKSAPGAAGRATIGSLRHWSNPNYTRIVIGADADAEYQHRLLKEDGDSNKPERLVIDFERAVLSGDIQKFVPINDELLLDARAGQFTPETVRVVVDIKSFKTYKIFTLKNPFRVILDVWGDKSPGPAVEVAAPAAAPAAPSSGAPMSIPLPESSGAAKVSTNDLARQLALGVRRIVIDPGHGGKDLGASGAIAGVNEKDVVLAIAKRLAQRAREQLGVETILTRSDDRYIDLEERTAIANTKNADLFVSIHTNAARDPQAYGIETYFLNLATDESAILVAARENATSTKNISDLQTILTDLMQNAKINESSRLAGHIQEALTQHLRKRNTHIRSKGVKKAPFYVLLGAQMPAVLIETSFISNPRECDRLMNPQYQEQLCDGILRGIRQYISQTSPTALSSTPAGKRAESSAH
jgi:N-acetylmuramoyl-L-alanine amidase